MREARLRPGLSHLRFRWPRRSSGLPGTQRIGPARARDPAAGLARLHGNLVRKRPVIHFAHSRETKELAQGGRVP